jgi:hypothetical protein
MSEDANITALDEKDRKIKNKIRFLEIIRGLIIFFFIVWAIFFALFSLSTGGAGAKVFLFVVLSWAIVPWIFVVPGRLITYLIKKLKKQEAELKKRLLAFLHPTSNCANCGKPLVEGNTFCSYCGNKRTP